MAPLQEGVTGKIQCQKEIPKTKKSKAGDDNNSTNNDAKRLKLSDSVINGLTTDIMIGDRDARKRAKRWFENANKRTSDQTDSLVKDMAWNWVLDIWT
jgi:hypothetical protein